MGDRIPLQPDTRLALNALERDDQELLGEVRPSTLRALVDGGLAEPAGPGRWRITDAGRARLTDDRAGTTLSFGRRGDGPPRRRSALLKRLR